RVSRSKRKSEAPMLACIVVTAATALSQQTAADLPQIPNITLRMSRSADSFAFGKYAQPAKFLISLFQQFGNWKLRNLLESLAQRLAKIRGNRIIVPVCAALRLGDNFVHNFKFKQILSGQLERLGRFGRMPPVSPQDRGTRFGADHRVIS